MFPWLSWISTKLHRHYAEESIEIQTEKDRLSELFRTLDDLQQQERVKADFMADADLLARRVQRKSHAHWKPHAH